MLRLSPRIQDGHHALRAFVIWFKETDKSQRFGQWVYNNYNSDDKPWPELFYAETHEIAMKLILDDLNS